MPKFLGVSKMVYDSDLGAIFAGTPGADPSTLVYMVCNIETGDNATFTNPLELRVRITYYCRFYQFTTAALQ